MIFRNYRVLLLLALAILLGSFVKISAVSDSSATNLKDLPQSFFHSGGNFLENSAIAKVLATDKGTNVTFTDPYTGTNFNNTFAGTFKAEVNSQSDVKLFCIDISHHLAFWKASQPHTYVDAGNTPSQITYILNNYYPYKALPYAGSIVEKSEAAAVQLAIWHYADGVDANTITNSTIKARTLQIIADADANSGNTVPVATLTITPASQTLFVGQVATMRVNAYNEIGQPVPNVTISLLSEDGTLSVSNGVTNNQGFFEFTVQQLTGNSATVTASASVTVPQGTRFVHSVSPDVYQKLVLATPVVAKRNFNATVEWQERADLRINKSVDDSNPSDGDVITFTVVVTNDGPTSATNVEVSDLIDSGFEIQNVSTSQGFYYYSSPDASKTIIPDGLWYVGDLASGSSATLTITVKVNATTLLSSQLSFGDADDFNVFVFNDVNQPSSDTEGKMAAGRDIFLANYSVGDKLTNSNGTEDVLLAGRNLTFLTGAVFAGNVVYGYQSNLPVDYVSVEGSVRTDTVINFENAKSYLVDLSSTIANYPINGKDTLIYSALNLTGSHPIVNIFNVDANDFNTSLEIVVNVPFGSTALINVNGDSLVFDGGLALSGADKFTTLFNFYEATKLTIQSIDVQGSVLAPKADVNYPAGQLNGQFIANSITGQGQFNIAKFIGNIPGTTVLQNIAEVTYVDQLDPDSEYGNGLANEDDYASIDINVTANLSVGSGTNNANWEYVGGVSDGEIVWTLVRDNESNLLSGTWGGKVYRSLNDGLTWSHLNPNMNVGYIWKILVNTSGSIVGYGDVLVATEKGIYNTLDNGTTWSVVALENKDVRALLIKDNTIYAGVWGEGIYVSVGGSDWTLKNQGLTFTAVNSLAADSQGNLFVATFGGGIFKSADNAENWIQLSVGYDHIWSIAINNADEIFAGTYGNGLFYSNDGGTTFTKQFAVDALYIYSVTTEGTNVFASAWNGGVYYYQSAVESGWNSIGMAGFSVSSVYTDRGILYAATSDGKLYKNATPTGVNEDGNNLNYSFSLEQNYPNPFNPSTIIKYTIAEQVNVKLTVYDMLGREVAVLVNSEMNSGAYSIVWNASDKMGKKLASGIYFYTLKAGNFNQTNKMLLLK